MDNGQSGYRAGGDYQVIDADRGALLLTAGTRVLRVPLELGGRLHAGLSAQSEDERREWDGIAETHDRTRPTKNGNRPFAKISELSTS